MTILDKQMIILVQLMSILILPVYILKKNLTFRLSNPTVGVRGCRL